MKRKIARIENEHQFDLDEDQINMFERDKKAQVAELMKVDQQLLECKGKYADIYSDSDEDAPSKEQEEEKK